MEAMAVTGWIVLGVIAVGGIALFAILSERRPK